MTVLHLCTLINTFYYDYVERPTATSLLINSGLPMARSIVKFTIRAEVSSTKQKRDRAAKDSGAKKHAKRT